MGYLPKRRRAYYDACKRQNEQVLGLIENDQPGSSYDWYVELTSDGRVTVRDTDDGCQRVAVSKAEFTQVIDIIIDDEMKRRAADAYDREVEDYGR